MNIKTLILVLCITFISSHPVKEEMTTTTEKMTTTTEKMTTEKEDCNFLNLLRDENIFNFISFSISLYNLSM